MNCLRRVAAIAALVLPIAIFASPAESRNYDCSKAGNADKAVCKEAAEKAAPEAPEAPTNHTSAATKATTRHYDCTKPGNADKEACKAAASGVSADKAHESTSPTASTPASNTDCSKWYDKLLAACQTPTASATTTKPAPKSTASSAEGAASHVSRENNDPTGAIAQCKDGTYSHAAHHEGACADHGGVAKWLSN